MAPLTPPKLDSRTYGDLVAQLEELAGTYSGWRPAPNGQDPGSALIRIFARMMSHVIGRLNQVPEKHHLAFLDLLGAQRLPPRPARAALSFQLAEGAKAEASVPAGTQVAATSAPDGGEEIVFATERALVLTRARLTSLIVRERRREWDSATPPAAFLIDRASDRTPLPGGTATEFQAFVAHDAVEHSLFLACDSLFTRLGVQRRWLTLQWQTAPTVDMVWSFWDGATWQALTPQKNGASWQLNLPAAPAVREINGRSARWVRGQLTRIPLSGDTPAALPILTSVSASVELKRDGVAPDVALFNTAPLDISKDFYPLGERPRFNDTFAVASSDVFSQPGRKVTVSLTLTPSLLPMNPTPPDTLKLVWELWNGSTWQKLGESTKSGSTDAGASFVDRSQAFTVQPTGTNVGKEIEFNLPQQLGETEVGGRRNRWLRVRLVGGHYGEDQKVVYTDGQVPKVLPATYQPPSIQSLKLSYTSTVSRALEACFLLNDGTYEDCTARLVTMGSPVTPFVLSADPGPSLYLGFDQAFANRPTLLHLEVALPRPEEVLAPALTQGVEPPEAEEPLQLEWEYRGANGWAALRAEDETQALSRSGQLRFIGPADFTASREFGQVRCWLRVRWLKGGLRERVRLRRVLTNTVWASHATTATREVLGSSNGEPDQVFTATRTPVLPGPRLEVREPSLPEPQEQAELEALEGPDAVTTTLDERGETHEVWVRWHAVPDLRASQPRDRHYVIDHQTGEVRFGNGRQGRIPPVGRDGIRLAWYRSGGGARGNVPARALTQMKSTVPYVDGAINPDAASGGADLEELERLKERSSRTLRHRGLAVTVDDFADLAREASPDVARVQVITPSFQPADQIAPDRNMVEREGQVLVVIIPSSADPQPVPSRELLDRVETYVRDRCPPAARLEVCGPAWAEVHVTVSVIPESLEASEAVREQIQQALARYLHPLHGGDSGEGWDFGRWPHRSDLYALLMKQEGVDRIDSLSVSVNAPQGTLPQAVLIYSRAENISVTLKNRED
ncbi:putative baseplate assembly protein [Hyalangium gracile]|uniref:putative baseplate assembly protein n=1 Tax=Hyalangium gracile TaxID=394092 RepID=UPI001CCDE62C|nr:putative baseplate assembly protein [Hyalangium gracile]